MQQNLERIRLAIKKNDLVQVIAGKEKGKTAKVLEVDAKANRVKLQGLNLLKRHRKATQSSAARIEEKEGSLSYSNILLFCSHCNRGVRHGIVVRGPNAESSQGSSDQNNKQRSRKARVCKRCGEALDQL